MATGIAPLLTPLAGLCLAVLMAGAIHTHRRLGASGLLSIAFGVLAVIFPGAGALAVITIVAVYAIIFSVLSIALGLGIRNLGKRGVLHFVRSTPRHA